MLTLKNLPNLQHCTLEVWAFDGHGWAVVARDSSCPCNGNGDECCLMKVSAHFPTRKGAEDYKILFEDFLDSNNYFNFYAESQLALECAADSKR